MKRVLSSIGIGNATVDTVFPRTELVPGETVTADVELYGGETSQEIDRIYFDLKAHFSEGDGDTELVEEFTVEESLTLDADEERTIPVDIHVPNWTPLTQGGVSVWLETGLDIDWAKDPTDEDAVDIVPGEFTAALFEAVEQMGFALRYAERVETSYLDDRPFAQEFDFQPTDSQFTDVLDELEITIMPREDDLRIFVEFDQVDAVAEEYDRDFDEQEIPITFDRADPDRMRRRLEQELDQHA